jgi:hypothetical protein
MPLLSAPNEFPRKTDEVSITAPVPYIPQVEFVSTSPERMAVPPST